MAATHIIVVYEAATGVLRHKVLTNDDDSIDYSVIRDGEDFLLLPLTGPYDNATCERAIYDKIRPCKHPASVAVGL